MNARRLLMPTEGTALWLLCLEATFIICSRRLARAQLPAAILFTTVSFTKLFARYRVCHRFIVSPPPALVIQDWTIIACLRKLIRVGVTVYLRHIGSLSHSGLCHSTHVAAGSHIIGD